MTSKRIIKQYRTLVYWHEGLVTASACYKAEAAQGFEWSDEERKELHRASNLLHQAKGIVDELYSKRIGQAVTYDIRNGVDA